MRLETKSVNVEVSYKKVSVNSLVPKPTIIKRDSEGREITSKRKALVQTGVDEKGNPIYKEMGVFDRYEYVDCVDDKPMGRITPQYFHVQEDGSEKEVRPFKRSSKIKVLMEIPATGLNDYLVTSVYELFNSKDEDVVSELYEEAERYLKEDIMGVAQFSWGRGFVQYYALVFPVIREDRFVWVMALTQTKVIYQHMMDVPLAKKKIPAPPTVEALPSMEAFVS